MAPVTWWLLFLGVGAQQLFQQPMDFDGNSTSACEEACSSLTSQLGEKVIHNDIYTFLEKAYISNRQLDVPPACLVIPTSIEDVSEAVKVIGQHQCPFAVRSGGHAMFAGASSAPGGITVDLRYLNDVQLSEGKETVWIGTGNKWKEVYASLDKSNLTVTGGRADNVGVGGFLLGGGISYMSRLHGWGVDNVKTFEIVLANGSISNVSYSTNPDLYWALRGGGSNFGIVTRFELFTYHHGPMWGDFNMHLLSDSAELLTSLDRSRAYTWSLSSLLDYTTTLLVRFACFVGYCSNFERFAESLWQLSVDIKEDPAAQFYSTLVLLPYVNLWSGFFHMKHAGGLENTAAFHEIKSMKKIYSTKRIGNNTDFAGEIGQMAPFGFRQSYETFTFKADFDVLKEIMKIYISEIELLPKRIRLIASLPMSFISKDEVAHNAKNGGNPIGIKVEDCPLTMVCIALGWKSKEDDELVLGASRRIRERAEALTKKKGVDHPYLYQNYGAKDQDIFAGYGKENRERLREIQRKYDPEGVIARLQAGYFKVLYLWIFKRLVLSLEIGLCVDSAPWKSALHKWCSY